MIWASITGGMIGMPRTRTVQNDRVYSVRSSTVGPRDNDSVEVCMERVRGAGGNSESGCEGGIK